MAQEMGLTLAGLPVFDIMCLTEFLIGKRGYEDIRIMGFSGGGLQALYAAALDERPGTVFISGYFHGFKEALLEMAENCSCNYIPSLRLHFDIQDVAALIAPRPLVIQSAESDHLAGRRGLVYVPEPMEELRCAYSLPGCEDRVYHHIVSGGHHLEKEGVSEALRKVTGPSA